MNKEDVIKKLIEEDGFFKHNNYDSASLKKP